MIFLAIGLTLLGYGLGLLIRNSAATICLLLLWPLIAENLIAGLLNVAGADGATKFLPYSAGIDMAIPDPGDDVLGRIPGGGLYFFAWVLVIAGVRDVRPQPSRRLRALVGREAVATVARCASPCRPAPRRR